MLADVSLHGGHTNLHGTNKAGRGYNPVAGRQPREPLAGKTNGARPTSERGFPQLLGENTRQQLPRVHSQDL